MGSVWCAVALRAWQQRHGPLHALQASEGAKRPHSDAIAALIKSKEAQIRRIPHLASLVEKKAPPTSPPRPPSKRAPSKGKERKEKTQADDDATIEELEARLEKKFGRLKLAPTDYVDEHGEPSAPRSSTAGFLSQPFSTPATNDKRRPPPHRNQQRAGKSFFPNAAATRALHERWQAERQPRNATRDAHVFRLRPPLPEEEEARYEEEQRRLSMERRREEERRARRRSHVEETQGAFEPFSFDSAAVDSPTGLPGDDVESEEDAARRARRSIFDDAASFESLVSSLALPSATHQSLLQNLRALGAVVPTKIQTLAVPTIAMARNHSLLAAQTGSGKTLAFLLSLLPLLRPDGAHVQAVVLAPSRELALQIGRVASRLLQDTPFRAATLIGGANARLQLQQLREQRPQIVVATPGRLAEVVFKLDKLRLGGVRALVLDEVDQLLHDAFRDEVRTLLEATPLVRRPLVDAADRATGRAAGCVLIGASATAQSDAAVARFFDEYCGDAGWSQLAANSAQLPRSVTHAVLVCPRVKMLEQLARLLRSSPPVERAFVFVQDAHRVDVVTQQLYAHGLVAAPLHGDASKDDRKEVLARLSDGRLRLVVATELAARGLDVPRLSHVVNLDLPSDAGLYVHR